MTREPDAAAISAFAHALLAYADDGGFVSIRAFDQFNDNVPPPYDVGVRVNGVGLDPIIAAAVAGARYAANATDALVFAPPIATFKAARGAAEADLVNCVCISVEVDAGNTQKKRERLEGLLGPATVVVASGGEWIDSDTGEVFPKQHWHWRLSEPTRTPEEHAALKHARRLACALVGADPSAKSSVHPMRWPGSWHLKATPKLATIIGLNNAAEVYLPAALEALETAAEAAGLREAGTRDAKPSGSPQAPLWLVQSALEALPNNDEHWDYWIKIGLLTYAAAGGSEEGLAVWNGWSHKSSKFVAGTCEERWDHFHKSPPTRGGAGTLFFLAKATGWQRPGTNPGAGKARSRGTAFGKLTVFSMPDLDTAPPRSYLIKGLIAPNEISVWVGPPKCGKSFLLMGVAYKLSCGLVVFGRRVRQTNALYIAAEGEGGIGNRLKALRARYGNADGFHWIAQQVDLFRSDVHLEDVKAAAQAYQAGLIVIDTVARVMAGGDENAPSDMGALVLNLTELRNDTKAHIAAIHHGTKASKGINPRGHSSLIGAEDALIEVLKDDRGNRTATMVHAKDDSDGALMPFSLRQVGLGTDGDGDPVTTLVFEEAGPHTGSPAAKQKLTHNEAIGLKCLTRAMTADAILTTVGDGLPERVAVHVEHWRRWFYQEGMPGTGQNTKKTAFSRVRTSLISKGVVQASSDFVWPVC
jgi:hypothetical protein